MPRHQTPPRYEREANGYWYAYWYEPGAEGDRGRTKRCSLDTKEEDEARVRFAHWLLAEKKEQSKDTLTCADIIRYYITNVIDKKRTDQRRRKAVLLFLSARMGYFSAYSVTGTVVNDYIDQRRKEGYADGTIKNDVYALRAAYSYAAKHGVITMIPVFESPGSSPVKEDWLSREEIEIVMKAAEAYRPDSGALAAVEIFFALALRTAARSTAILDLEWSKVSFTTGLIDYRSNWWLSLNERERSKRRAVMPMSKKLLPVLERAFEERTSKYVVPRSDDQQWTVDAAIRNIEADTGIKCNPHKWRRTYATLAAMAGVSMEDIARVLGNTIAVCEKRYARFAPGYLQHAVNIENAEI